MPFEEDNRKWQNPAWDLTAGLFVLITHRVRHTKLLGENDAKR